jgi:hypothetical protein
MENQKQKAEISGGARSLINFNIREAFHVSRLPFHAFTIDHSPVS